MPRVCGRKRRGARRVGARRIRSTPQRLTRAASRCPNTKQGATVSRTGEEESDGEPDGEPTDKFFHVEKIVGDGTDKNGTCIVLIKWKGYEELSWEPKKNLKERGRDSLKEYYEAIGGEHKLVAKADKPAGTTRLLSEAKIIPCANRGGRRGNKVNVRGINKTSPTTAEKWSPPSGSWEDKIETIDRCEKSGDVGLVVYITWKNGRKTKHNKNAIYKRCPQKILDYYERHAIFEEREDDTTGIGMQARSVPTTAEQWSPPPGSWENEIKAIIRCGKNDAGSLEFVVVWKNGQEARYDKDTITKKCPQKMIQFLLGFVVFKGD